MPIWNLTETEEREPTVYDILGYPDIKCYKGDRKTGSGDSTRPGKDLKEKIRVVTAHRRVTNILTDCYGSPVAIGNDPFEENSKKPSGDWHVDELNVYLALDDIDLTFETSMKAFDRSGTLLMCDRRTILKEAQTIQTYKGQRRVMKTCNKPCALADSDENDWDCPLGCKPAGILHFYIRECLDLDVMVHAQFETKAFGDVPNIMKRLRAIKQELGSLTQSPYPCYWTRHKIPLVISRVARKRSRPDVATKTENGKKRYEFTGKKADGEFYDLDIQVDPVWMDWYRKQRLLEELLQRGLNPTADVVAGLMTGDATIDVKAIATSVSPALPQSLATEDSPQVVQTAVAPDSTSGLVGQSQSQRAVTDDMLRQLENALIQNNWTEEAISTLLAQFDLENDPRSMTKEQWVEICALASNIDCAKEYNKAALMPLPTRITSDDWTGKIEPTFRQHGWFPIRGDGKEDKRAVVALLQSEYAISRMGELLTSQVAEVLELAAAVDVRDRWLEIYRTK